MLYRVFIVKWAASEWNTDRENWLGKKARLAFMRGLTAVLGFHLHHTPGALQAVRKTLPTSFTAKLPSTFPIHFKPSHPLSGLQTLRIPQYTVWESHAQCCLLPLVLVTFRVLISIMKGVVAVGLTRLPGFQPFRPWSGHTSCPSQSHTSLPSLLIPRKLTSHHLTSLCDCLLVVEWAFLPFLNSVKLNGLETCVQYSKNLLSSGSVVRMMASLDDDQFR